MNEESAKALIAAVRTFGDSVMGELFRLKGKVPEEQFRYWSLAAGKALGAVDRELLSPICREFPAAVPAELREE